MRYYITQQLNAGVFPMNEVIVIDLVDLETEVQETSGGVSDY